MQEIQKTVADILRAFGETIIQNPLRLEALLRDLHPDQPSAISVTMEMLHTGILNEYANGASRQYCINRFRTLAGLSPKAAELGVDIWKPFVQHLGTTQHTTILQQNNVQPHSISPTVEDVLSQYQSPTHDP